FVDLGDATTVDNNSLRPYVSDFSSKLINVGTSNEAIEGTFTVANLERNEKIVVEIWVALDFPPLPPALSGNVQTTLVSAKALYDNSTISTGSQTTPLLKVSGFLEAPAAGPDDYTISEDTSLVVRAPGVLGNDTDPKGNYPLTAHLSSGPSHGTLTLNPDGSFTYKPSLNYNGDDSFIYFARNSSNVNSALTTVTIHVNPVNDAPSGADKTVTTNEDTAYTFAASDFGFSDPNDSPPNTLLAVKITTLPA